MTMDGKLSVHVKSDSYLLEDKTPIYVRDSNMRLLSKETRYLDRRLPIGLYEISAVLEDGKKHSRLVQVKGTEHTVVELGVKEESEESGSIAKSNVDDVLAYDRRSLTKEMVSMADADTEPDKENTAELLKVTGASLVHKKRTLWTFKSAKKLKSVPTALIRINNQKILISLPTGTSSVSKHSNMGPEYGDQDILSTCVVRVEETRTGAHVNAWISPERSVANALHNMLASGYVLDAAEVAADAVDLLGSKYSDPTGAVLGALILHKVGRLKRWTSWVENLARDFDWLPDGKVLLATLLYDDGVDRDRALELAITASSQRMLYTESYSLLLDLLRRWPCDTDQQAMPIRHAIKSLVLLAPYIDWESICLNNVIEGEE